MTLEPSTPWWGLLLGSQRSRQEPRAVYAAVRSEANVAVQGGLDLLVAPEHLMADPYTMLQPWPLLAALRQDIGDAGTVACIIAGLTSPLQAMRNLTTLVAIGDGAVGLALGAGYRQEEFAAAGRDFAARFQSRQAVLAAVAHHTVDHRWSCTTTARAARHAARAGALWYAGPGVTDDALRAMQDAAGGPGILRRDVFVANSPADVRSGVERFVAPKYAVYQRWNYGPGAGEVIAGTPEQVIEPLSMLVELLRPEGVVLRLCWPDMSHEEAIRHLATFLRDVLPALPRRSAKHGN